MQISVMIDLAIVAVVVLSMAAGARKGLFRSLMGLVTVVAALVVSAHAADLGAGYVTEHLLRPATAEAVEQRVEELSAGGEGFSLTEKLEQAVEAIPNGLLREKAEGLLAALEPEVTGAEDAGQELLLAAAMGVVDEVLEHGARPFLRAVLCMLCFTVVSLLLRLLVNALDLTFRLPLLRQVNSAGGLLFGAAKGLVLAGLGVWLLGMLGLWVTPETVEHSCLLKIVAGWTGAAA